MPVEIIEKELSLKIIEAAIEVHKQLGPGYAESLYEEALKIELQQRGYRVDQQKKYEVKYKDQTIGLHVLDMVVEERVILELKAASDILPISLATGARLSKIYGSATGFSDKLWRGTCSVSPRRENAKNNRFKRSFRAVYALKFLKELL